MRDSFKGRLKMFCRLLILVFISCLFWIPTVSHVLHKRGASFYIANETMCIVDGDVYRNGDPVPTDDECERCTCRPPGFSCVLRDCDNKPGCKAVRRAGECCPEYVCGCVHNSRLYEDGELIKDLQNNCYTCRCHGSSISCTFAECGFRSDCPPEYIPGECCPRYDHCPPAIPMTSTTTTTTTAASPTLIQQEIDFFNLTSQHVQKFTTEGTTMKIEEITTSDFTTPAPMYTIKFSLSGEKISSIHDFDGDELTTLLPLQSVTYKETTRHVVAPQGAELTTLKDGLIIASFDKTTETASTSESQREIDDKIPLQTTTDSSILSIKTATDVTDDTSSKVSFTENNVITVLSEDVSDWDDGAKTEQEAEPSTVESDSEENNIDFTEVELVTDEITQQESSRATTVVPVSNHTLESTLVHTYEIVHEDISTTEHPKVISHEKIQTESTTDFKSVTDLLPTTTIDDETVTRKVTGLLEDDLQSSLDELHSVVNISSTKPSETTEASFEKFDKISVHTDQDNDFTSLITNREQSSTDEIPHFDAEEDIDSDSKTTDSSEEIHFTTYDNLITSIDNAEKTTELYQHGETLNGTSYSEEYSITSEIATAEDIDTASHHSLDEISKETSHHHVESSSEQAEMVTDIAHTQTVISSSESNDSDEFLSTYQTAAEKETSADRQPTDKEHKTSVNDLLSTSHYWESTSTNISPTTDGLLEENFNALDAETTAYPEHDKTTDSDHSVEITGSTLESIVKDITSLFSQTIDVDKYSTATATDLENIHINSTEHSINDSMHTSVIDKNYDTTIDFEVTKYDADKDTSKVFEVNESLNKTDFGLDSVGEDEEREAESEKITTEILAGQTSPDHVTHTETLHSEEDKIYVYTEQSNADKTTIKTIIIEEKQSTGILNNIDYDATLDSVHTEYTTVKSIISSGPSLTNSSHVFPGETFSVTEITNYTTENLTDSFKVTESDREENVGEHLTSKTDSATDDLIVTPKSHESTSQPQSTSEIVSETTTDQTVIHDKKEEIIPVKQHVEVSVTRDTVITQTPEFVETTFKIPTTEKISTTTEDDMPNELPAFEPPLANILKQHMLFNRPVSQTVTSNTEVNLPKETSDENEIEKLPLTVDENSLDTSDLDESGNKIISFNQEYTIQDSEILSTADTLNNEKPKTSDENGDNLYFVKTEYDSVTQISNNDQTSTQIIYNERSTPEIEDLSPAQNYNDNEESTSNIEIMDSEELHNEEISNESNDENILTNASIATSLYETNNDVNVSTSDKENSSGLAETTISLINNAETSSIPQEKSHSASDKINDSGTTTTESDLNEKFELNTNVDSIEPVDELDSDFIYEDAESSENFSDRNMIQTSTPVEELQTHLITSQPYTTSSSLSEKVETSTQSRPISSGLNYTSITSDSAKEEYLAAIKFSTLYEQKFFTTPQQFHTFASSSGIQNVLNSTIISDIDAVDNKRTSDSSELTQYESMVKKKQTYGYNEEHSVSAEDSETIPEQDSSLIITSSEDENLSVSNEHSTNLNSFHSFFSTLAIGSSTNPDIAEVTTQSNIELLIDQSELDNSSLDTSSIKNSNLTKSSDQDYASRLKNEFAEYGVLGGVFITGKSKYEVNTTNEHDKNPNMTIFAEFPNAVEEQELNPTVENNNIVSHNHSDNLELENDAEADYSSNDSDLNTRYSTTTVLKNEEEIESDDDANKNKNKESLEKDIIRVISTITPSNETKVEETSNSKASPEISTTFIDFVSDDSSDEILQATTVKISEVLSTSQIDSEEGDKDAFLTKVEIQQEKGPEKGGDWFEPTDPNLVLPSVEKQENVSDTMSQFDKSDAVSSVTTENHTEHGPEKGGDVFEPTFPDLFPIDNANSDTESDGTKNASQIISTKITDLNNEEIFDKNVSSIISYVNESKSNSDTSTESNMKLDFVPPLPILLKSFPKLMQSSNSSTNGSENIETVNNYEISKLDLNQDYMSDERNVELHPKRPSERNLDPSYDLSDVISKVFKSPGYDSEVHLRTIKDHSDLNKKQSLRLKRSANIQPETSENIWSDSEPNNKPPAERNGIISQVSKAPDYDAEVHLVSLKDYPELKKEQYLRLKRDSDIQLKTSENNEPDSEPNNKLPANSAENVYLFDNRNILLVEGYGQKPSGFVPVTSSLIIVHSDDENETEVDSKQDKSNNESKDISVSEFLDKAMSTSPEKDDSSSDLSKRHPKV